MIINTCRKMFATFSLLSFLNIVAHAYEQWPIQLHMQYQVDVVKVPVVLGVMSRCPDALICESVFDKVQKRVEDKMNLTLSFIAHINNDSKYGADCMHGPDECAGNIHELCAAKYLPFKQWWNFLICQNFNGRDKIGTPDVALSCANAAGFDWEESGVGTCAGTDGSGTGKEGIELLHTSINRSQALNIEKSCTVIINEKVVCIHDDEWKKCVDGHDAADFIRQIETEYDKLNEL